MTSSNPQTGRQLSFRIFSLLQMAAMPVAPLAAYLVGMVLGLKGEEAQRSVLTVLPPVILVVGVTYPFFLVRWLVGRALREFPGEQRGRRLERMLRLPWQMGLFGIFVPYFAGGLGFGLPVCLMSGRSPFLAVAGAVIGGCFGLMLSFIIAITVERWVMPLCVEAQRQYPGVRPVPRGFFWVRQSWYLPYAFITCVVSLILLGGCVVAVQTAAVQRRLIEDMQAAGQERAASMVQGLTTTILGELSVPLGGVGFAMLVVPAISAWMLARRQAWGAAAVLHAIERLSAGRIESPQWASTDEMGDLSFGLQSMLAQLSRIPEMLQQSASKLVDAGSSLSEANAAQRQTLASQAAALQETSVTAQEIKQTSEVAVDRAQSVVAVADRAEALGRSGTAAIEESLSGFVAIRDYVQGIRGKMGRLQASAQQISEITEAVKDLADQSHLLAVNAAIEAARSGEHGKGFAVVAQEIRNLADQSIRATTRIRRILEEVTGAMQDAVTMSDAGAVQVEGGLQRVKASGDSLRQLTEIVNESSTAARQIAATVSQQNSGFAQIFSAIGDLSNGMEQALSRLESTQEAARMLQRVSEQVGQMAQQYRAE
ncbi:methyl-accepting chemotaxis protein [Myxococcaceae bacterium GXIMD 01537]